MVMLEFNRRIFSEVEREKEDKNQKWIKIKKYDKRTG